MKLYYVVYIGCIFFGVISGNDRNPMSLNSQSVPRKPGEVRLEDFLDQHPGSNKPKSGAPAAQHKNFQNKPLDGWHRPNKRGKGYWYN